MNTPRLSRMCAALRSIRLAGMAALWLLLASACATLPDADALIERHAGQAVKFVDANGPLSAKRNEAILAELKRRSGNIDILDKQIALEQSVVGSPLVLGNRIALLQDGATTYAAMFAAIRAARDHINLETYIIEDDDIGRQFADLLIDQQRRGIQVNLIYDSFGAIATPGAFFKRLIDAGVGVLEFNPINPLSGRTPWLLNNRDHRKLLIVDGRIAFLGGINISSVYSSGSIARRLLKPAANAAEWRDTDLEIEGPVVAELQKLFIETWTKQRGVPLAERNYFPDLPAAGKDMVRAIGSTPDDPYSLMYLTLMSAIGNAERQVQITQAYFVPDPQLLAALIEAAGRGVEVQLILPSHSDSALVFHAGRSHYSSLIEAGVKLYERVGSVLHSKTAVIDGVWSTVGSTNLDWRSFLDNDEINAVVLGHDFGLKMQAMFKADLRTSRAIEPEVWKKRPLLMRIKEWLARLWGRVL